MKPWKAFSVKKIVKYVPLYLCANINATSFKITSDSVVSLTYTYRTLF